MKKENLDLPTTALTQEQHAFFRAHGYVDLGRVFSADEVALFVAQYDRDRSDCGYMWKQYGMHQSISCDALVSWPEIDALIRHPNVVPALEELMGGPITFEEVCVRHMAPFEGEGYQGWHRDKAHWPEHPLRMDYIQTMVYLSDVGPDTHCFSISPEGINADILDKEEQLAKVGGVDLHGPAGTVIAFNVAVLHSATVRPTQIERKTVQTYYGHPGRAYLSNDSVIPPRLWRDHQDEAVRAFYGKLNDKSRIYARAHGLEGV